MFLYSCFVLKVHETEKVSTAYLSNLIGVPSASLGGVTSSYAPSRHQPTSKQDNVVTDDFFGIRIAYVVLLLFLFLL